MNKYLQFVLVVATCLYFLYYAKTYTDWHFIDYVNLIFHEAGHVILFLFGAFISVLGGSLFQVIVPTLVVFHFFHTGQKISGALALLWVGQNFLNISIYVGDAVAMQLDLLGGDSVIHDWNYILGNLGLLHSATTIAFTLYCAGVVIICVGAIVSLYYSLMPFSRTS